MSSSLQEDAANLAILKELKSHHENIVKTINSEIIALGQRIWTQSLEDHVDQLRVSGDLFKDFTPRIVTPCIEYKPSVAAGQRPALILWLKEHKYESLVQETVHPKTLESFVKEQKDKNLPLPDTTILNIYTIETAKVTRARTKKAGKSVV